MFENPYTDFMTSVSGPFGRETLLKELAQFITLPRPDHRDLHGLPGTGKSTVLRYMASPDFTMRAPHWFLGPFREAPQLLLFVYVSGWVQSIHPFFLIQRQFYGAVAARRGQTELPALPSFPTPGALDDPDAALIHMEGDVLRLADAGIRPVFLLDDFHAPGAFGQLTKDQTSRLGSWKDTCAFILATERRLEEVNPEAKGSPLFKQVPRTAFGDLPEDEALAFVRSPLPPGYQFPDDDVRCLYELAGGFPYLLLLAGRGLWDLRRRAGLLEAGSRSLSSQLRALLEGRLAQDFESTFHLYYEALNEEQRDGLHLLAESPAPVAGAALDKRSNRLSWLPEYGLVYLRADTMGLFSPLFTEFVLRQRPVKSLPARTAPSDDALSGLQRELYDFLRDRPGQPCYFEDIWRGVSSWSAIDRQPTKADRARIHLAISKLRQHLRDGEEIVSLRGRGYRFERAQAAGSAATR